MPGNNTGQQHILFKSELIQIQIQRFPGDPQNKLQKLRIIVQRSKILSSILNPDQRGRITGSHQNNIHQQPRQPAISVRIRVNFDQPIMSLSCELYRVNYS